MRFKKALLENVQAKNKVAEVFTGHCGLKCSRIMRDYKPVGVEFFQDFSSWGFPPYSVYGTRKGLNRYLKGGGKIKAEKRLVKYLIASKQAVPFLRDVNNYFIV